MVKALTAALIIFAVFPPPAYPQTDIEKNLVKTNATDFSGTYEVSGLLTDSGTYTGSLTLEKWNTFTTPKGNVLQTFKMEYVFGEKKSNGVAVYDGSRLYYATGEGENENYYLLLLSKLEFSDAAGASLQNYWNKNNDPNREGDEYFEWEGKEPWYGYLNPAAQTYGFFFWIDGIWGQYETRKNGFPFRPDSGSWGMLELNEDGEFGKKQRFKPEGYWEAGGFVAEPEGMNLRLTMDFLSVTSSVEEKSYWGTAMMTTHPRTGDSLLIAMLGGPDNCTVGWMDVSGKIMAGEWAPGGGEGQGSEEWVVPAEVLARNPTLFK